MAYRDRVLKDLERWRAKGWIDDEGAAAIRADLPAHRAGFNFVNILIVLCAALLCFAAMSFVAANWAAISRPAKLIGSIIAIWLAYGGAAYAKSRGATMVGHGLALLGAGLFGAGIMLIGQMYHLSGEPTGAVMLWALGALGAAALLQSPPSLVLGAGLVILWYFWRVVELEWRGDELVRLYGDAWLAWIFVALVALRIGWRGATHLVAVGASFLVIRLGAIEPFNLDLETSFLLSAVLAMGVMALGLVWDAGTQRKGAPDVDGVRGYLAPKLSVYGFITTFICLILFQISSDNREIFAFAAIPTALALIAVIWISAQREEPVLLWWAYAAMAGQLITIYVRTIGGVLNTSLVFLIGAGLVAALAFFAWRISKARDALKVEAQP